MQLTTEQRLKHLEKDRQRVTELGEKVDILSDKVDSLSEVIREFLTNALAAKDPQCETETSATEGNPA